MNRAAWFDLDWRRIALLSLLPLSALITLVRELKQCGYGLAEPEVAILAAGLAIAALPVGMLALAGPRVLRPMLVTGVVLHMLLMEYVTSRGTIDVGLLPLYLRIVVFLVVVLGTGVIIWRLKENAALVAATVLGTILLGLVVETGMLRESRAAGLLTSTPGGHRTAARTATPSAALPPVIHVILDAHIGLGSIPDDIPGAKAARAEIRALYAEKGFALYPDAYSHFAESQLAIPMLMNGAGPEQVFDFIRPKVEAPYGYLIEESRWLESLKRAGYRLTVVQNGWIDYCGGMPELIDTCHSYPFVGPIGLKGADVPLPKKLEILGRYFAHRFLPWGWVETPPLSPLGSLRAVDRILQEMATGLDGNAYLLHLLLPHDGFVLDEQCKPVEGFGTWREDAAQTLGPVYNTASERRARYEAYIRQVRCSTKVARSLIETLERHQAFDRATVIVHGDHGSRVAEDQYKGVDPARLSERDIRDHFSTLYAVKAPGVVPGYHEGRASIQDLFARQLLGERRAPAPELVYVRTWPDWGRLPESRPLPPW